MDYEKWGEEYLEEAQALKERVHLLRKQLPTVRGEELILLNWRISMLQEMHLECLHTGNELQRKERAHEVQPEETKSGAVRL